MSADAAIPPLAASQISEAAIPGLPPDGPTDLRRRKRRYRGVSNSLAVSGGHRPHGFASTISIHSKTLLGGRGLDAHLTQHVQALGAVVHAVRGDMGDNPAARERVHLPAALARDHAIEGVSSATTGRSPRTLRPKEPEAPPAYAAVPAQAAAALRDPPANLPSRASTRQCAWSSSAATPAPSQTAD